MLRRDSAQAADRAAAARKAHEELGALLAERTRADKEARSDRRAADQAVTDANRSLSRAEADRNLAQGKLESLELELARLAQDEADARTRVAEAETAARDLGNLEEARGLLAEAKLTVEAARLTMLSKRALHDEQRREGEARHRRRGEIEAEIANWRRRLDTAGKRIAELDQRRAESESELEGASRIPAELAAQREELGASLTEAAARRAAAAAALSRAETHLRDATEAEREAERLASEAREARAGAEARSEAAADAARLASERIAEEHEALPEELLAQLGAEADGLSPPDAIEAEIARLRHSRDAMGAVNLRAEEDAREVQTEHDTLRNEKQDLEEAIAKLRSGIASLNREGRERLLTAFEEVNANFGTLFANLFGGGEARLVMVESDDPLEAGLEILCQPPGKKLSTLSLLSGGEQTLTALALIFAVFLANPAPICVLDEVDAPLDDANVTRFCNLLDEMTRRTQTRFLIITHHAVTMSRMDRLFGVTMGEQGVSQLVSVDLKKAEALVA